MTRRQIRGLGAAVLVSALMTACSTEDTEGPGPGASTATRSAPAAAFGEPETFADGLDAPWSIAFHGRTQLVSERDTARILEVDDSGSAREVGVIDGVSPRGEGGLLGIAVHENDLYVYFTADGENRIERHGITGDPGALALGPAETILDGLLSANYHNGGRIAFGPDGMLYATVGDAGGRDRAQDLDSLSGKILRMTPDGDVPQDNPFPNSFVYSYGHRNSQGIAWTEDGTMYASEFGQDTWDELNKIEAGGNYGWPEVEGIAGEDGFIDPLQQWSPDDASPSGIVIHEGTIYIANLRGERLRAVPLTDPTTADEQFVDTYGRLRDVAIAPDGSLWILTNNTDGRGDPKTGDDRIIRVPLR
ncbi:PQQ-dependent sugar dehydrogenase [Rhodococcus sp. NPDC055024]